MKESRSDSDIWRDRLWLYRKTQILMMHGHDKRNDSRLLKGYIFGTAEELQLLQDKLDTCRETCCWDLISWTENWWYQVSVPGLIHELRRDDTWTRNWLNGPTRFPDAETRVFKYPLSPAGVSKYSPLFFFILLWQWCVDYVYRSCGGPRVHCRQPASSTNLSAIWPNYLEADIPTGTLRWPSDDSVRMARNYKRTHGSWNTRRSRRETQYYVYWRVLYDVSHEADSFCESSTRNGTCRCCGSWGGCIPNGGVRSGAPARILGCVLLQDACKRESFVSTDFCPAFRRCQTLPARIQSILGQTSKARTQYEGYEDDREDLIWSSDTEVFIAWIRHDSYSGDIVLGPLLTLEITSDSP